MGCQGYRLSAGQFVSMTIKQSTLDCSLPVLVAQPTHNRLCDCRSVLLERLRSQLASSAEQQQAQGQELSQLKAQCTEQTSQLRQAQTLNDQLQEQVRAGAATTAKQSILNLGTCMSKLMAYLEICMTMSSKTQISRLLTGLHATHYVCIGAAVAVIPVYQSGPPLRHKKADLAPLFQALQQLSLLTPCMRSKINLSFHLNLHKCALLHAISLPDQDASADRLLIAIVTVGVDSC